MHQRHVRLLVSRGLRLLHQVVEQDEQLVAVGRADEEVEGRLFRVAEHMREGSGHEGNAIRRDPATQGLGVTGAPTHEHDRPGLDVLGIELFGLRHVVAVVVPEQLDRAAVDTAKPVQPGVVVADRLGVHRADVRGRTRQIEDRADRDRGVRFIDRIAASAGGEKRQGENRDEGETSHGEGLLEGCRATRVWRLSNRRIISPAT